MKMKAVAVSTAVAVSMGEVSPVAVSAAVAFVVAVLVAISVQWEADTRSPAAEPVRGAAATGVAIGAITITDSLMMSSSSATSAFRGGGAGAIRTDITVTGITRTITMDTAGTVTTMTPVMDTAMAADQGICGGCGGGDKRARRRVGFSLLLLRLDTLRNCLEEFAEGLQSAIPALRAVEENPESAV